MGGAAADTDGPSETGFREVPKTGVIYVMGAAAAAGYHPDDTSWANLGQGQPEIGPLPDGAPRFDRFEVGLDDHEYAPVAGLPELREVVAAYYNRMFRRGMGSRYTADNVAISAGGRAALTRAAAALGQINLGHFLPDYTAYEELLESFRPFLPIPILRDPEEGYAFPAQALRREVLGKGLGAVLMSNPCNPTGTLLAGDGLAEWIELARSLGCTLLLDEFYSHYVWREGCELPVSAARYVEDVNRDPVVLFDGLTKNWRYPGWRVAWTVGPRSVIEAVSSAGSFLDGGAPRPMQRLAVGLLDPERVERESRAIRAAFRPKLACVVERARRMGMRVEAPCDGTFYAFLSLRDLPPPLDSGMGFFRAALERRVITVPGVFFDVDPGQRRPRRVTRFDPHLRLSFGPPLAEVEAGMERLEELVSEVRASGSG